jgi:5'-3' exonuclease
MIYDACRSPERQGTTDLELEEWIIENVISKIKQYITDISPTNVVYIAFDGVAPFAKMNQQRIRRYKTGFLDKLDFSNADSPLIKTGSGKWNTSAVTPGTRFMELLSAKVEYAFTRSDKYFGVKTVIVSAANIAGEGEHKMFQYMRDNALQSETIAVYGLDSDLIMLSLFHCFACENIYIFREAPEFSHSILPKDMNVKPTDLLCLNHRKLAECILKEMGSNEQHRIYDYIFMCFFLGNDFLPHFPGLNIRTHGIYTLLETYKAYIGVYSERRFIHPESGQIQWKWVKFFLRELAKGEHTSILAEYKSRDKMGARKYPDKTPDDRAILFDNIPVLYRAEEMYICPEERGWEDRYYKMAFPEHEHLDKKELCIHYLEGLEWVFKYYTEGCPHWRWKYPHHYPPLLKDLVEYVPDFETEFINSSLGINRPFHPNVQLSYVIPPWNHAMLPKAARDTVDKYPELFVQMEDLKFQWMFCRYFWESHALLKDVPLKLLEEWDDKM